MAINISLKRLQIDKANSSIVIVIAITVFITIFSLTSIKTLYSQMQYQDKVVTAKQQALNQLRVDDVANTKLIRSYLKFNDTKNANFIGGNPTGNSPPNVSNARLILDALPSKYDYPALTSTVQYLLSQSGLNIDSIGGTDLQTTASSGDSATAGLQDNAPATPIAGQAVAMPFNFSVDGPYANIQNLFNIFQRSIRPISLQSLELSGNQNDLTLTATAQSYYQPSTSFKITSEVIPR